MLLSFALIVSSLSSPAHAWGARGHAIVCETAAYLLASGKTSFFQDETFGLAYYCNVPDFLWKQDRDEEERPEHSVDLETFDRIVPSKEWSENRKEFFSKHPDIPHHAGRAPWRIAQLHARAVALAKSLRELEEGKDREREELQVKWLTALGTLGHYVGDLSQPLHVTESYDGQATDQKGVHLFFEVFVLDQLGLGLAGDVFKKAQASWKTAPACESAFACATALARDSAKHVKKVLELDKKVGRDSLPAAAKANRDLIIQRLAAGAVTLAKLWSKACDFRYDPKIRVFDATPGYVKPN